MEKKEGKDILKKHGTSVRVYGYILNYCINNNINLNNLIMKGFDSYRHTDSKHALERLEYHENRVLHWKQIVLHNDNECGTKQQFCNTVIEAFKEHGRGSPESKTHDLNWLEGKAESLLDKGVVVTKEELYKMCKGEL